jgi:hypothetical protein
MNVMFLPPLIYCFNPPQIHALKGGNHHDHHDHHTPFSPLEALVAAGKEQPRAVKPGASATFETPNPSEHDRYSSIRRNHASGQVKERLTPAGSTLRLTQP